MEANSAWQILFRLWQGHFLFHHPNGQRQVDELLVKGDQLYDKVKLPYNYKYWSSDDVPSSLNELTIYKEKPLLRDEENIFCFHGVGPDIFAEFLEVSLHSILYNRNIYPSGVFERRKKYNVPVQMCIHPEVTDYVAKVINGIKIMVQEGHVEKVTMVILNLSGQPIERFVFEIDNPSGSKSEDKYLYSLEESLRAFLLKLNVCDSLLKPLPEDCSWAVNVHTKESTADKLTEYQNIQDFRWIPADEEKTYLKDGSILPLKSMTNEIIKMQMYVEESSNKGS